MRKIEQEISDAVLNGCRFSGGNTVVATSNSKTECFLHGHKIFQLDRKTGKFKWNDCCWATRTTASRLNACFDAFKSLSGRSYRYNFGTGKVLDVNSKAEIARQRLQQLSERPRELLIELARKQKQTFKPKENKNGYKE